MRRIISALLLSLGTLVAAPVIADEHGHDDHGHGDHAHGTEAPHADPHGEAAAHGEGHDGGHGHAITLDDFNWYYGMLAEQEGAEPSLLFRPKGMPVPFAALLLNSLILYYLLYRMLGGTVRDGLKKRKETILRGMEEASKMKREAEEQLAFYEAKLAGIDEEITRIRSQMKTTAEAERTRVLAEAKERRTRMERDALVLVEQELRAERQRLLEQTISSAVQSATESIVGRIGEQDQQRFAEEYLQGFRQAASSIRGRA